MIRGMEPDGPNQIWVSDITYIKTESEFLYLFLITDMYSKKIVGYKLSTSLDSSNAVNCLQDALENVCKPISGLIHHSDRGLQYCCKEYVSLLESHSIKISMTEKSDPLENPIAERVNGILKEEYLNAIVHDKTLTVNELDKVIEKYNRRRPHLSCDMLTPEEAHKLNGTLKRRWKNYYKNRELIKV
jgi:transposase InsO family protein